MKTPTLPVLISLVLTLTTPAWAAPQKPPAELQQLLADCSAAASLPAEQLPQLAERLQVWQQKLEQEAGPAAKLWRFRLNQCRGFVDYRLKTEQPKSKQ
ncbi:MAG: hypothetical protein D6751_10115 [Deltaproteobacteria bacterium]|nr:MAG: hypothetical protein D6751_10115 [Deltaproteobacteria bacterium]